MYPLKSSASGVAWASLTSFATRSSCLGPCLLGSAAIDAPSFERESSRAAAVCARALSRGQSGCGGDVIDLDGWSSKALRYASVRNLELKLRAGLSAQLSGRC